MQPTVPEQLHRVRGTLDLRASVHVLPVVESEPVVLLTRHHVHDTVHHHANDREQTVELPAVHEHAHDPHQRESHPSVHVRDSVTLVRRDHDTPDLRVNDRANNEEKNNQREKRKERQERKQTSAIQ